MENQDVITVKRAADILGVTPHYVRKLLREQKLKGIQDSKTNRWSVEVTSLEAYKKTDSYKNDLTSLERGISITIREAVQDVEECFDGDLISYVAFPGLPLTQIVPDDSLILDDLLNKMSPYISGDGKKFKRLILFLHSGGGILEAALKIVDIMRVYSNEFFVIVPILAKSAASIMCLSADKLFLTPISELGPVDPIIQSPTNPSLLVPARVIDSFFKSYALGNKRDNQDFLDEAMKKKMEDAFDPYLLGSYKLALEFSRSQLEELLKKLIPNDVSKRDEALKLFTEVSSHSYPITITKLERFGIGELIKDKGNLQTAKVLLSAYRDFMSRNNIVKTIGNRDENKNIIVKPLDFQSREIPTKTSI